MERVTSLRIVVGMHVGVLVGVVLAVGCASGSIRPASIAKPEIAARLTNEVFFGSGSSAPASIEVIVRNPANVPIVVRRIEIDSPGMAQYAILRTVRIFNQAIAPGETKVLSIFATAVTNTSRPTEPLTIRTIAEFQSGKDHWREVVITTE